MFNNKPVYDSHMPLLRGQTTVQKHMTMNALIVALFGTLVAALISMAFQSNAFIGSSGLNFPTVLFDIIVLFFVAYFVESLMDRGIDRAVILSLLGAIFVGIVSSLAVGSFAVTFGPVFAAIFVGVFIVDLLLEYTMR